MGALRKPISVALRPPQLQIFNDKHRFKAAVAGRRFGKTWLARSWLLDGAIKKPKSINWYTAPTYRQAKQLMWRPLKELIPANYIKYKDETDMLLEIWNGSIIGLRGTDNPDSLRGTGLHRVVLDECAFMKPDVWQEIIRPQLSDTLGDALFITTPKAFNWFYDLVMAAHGKKDWATFHFTTAQGGNVRPSEIETARAELDIRKFQQEYEASFVNMAGRIYYAFDYIENMLPPIDNRVYAKLPLLVGMDFNVNPMTAVLGHKIGDQFHCLDTIVIPNGNTEVMCQELRRRYPSAPIVVYPDPTADRRQTNAAAGVTDITILRRYGFFVMTPGAPWPMADKFNMANAAFCTAAGKRRVFLVNTKATTPLVKALSGYTYKENTGIPDKDSGLDHITDALAYLLCMEYPIVANARRIQTVGM